MRFAIVVTAACFAVAPLGAGTAWAADTQGPTISDPTTLIDTLTPETVSALVTEMGGTKVETKDAGGGKKLITFWDGEMPFNLAVGACDDQTGKCLALAEIAAVTTGTSDVTLDMLNTYNRDGLFLTAFKLDGNKIGFGRVLIVDGGVTKKNLVINVASFTVTLGDALAHLRGQLVSSTETRQSPTPMAAAGVRFNVVPVDPKQMSMMMDALLTHYKTTLGGRRPH